MGPSPSSLATFALATLLACAATSAAAQDQASAPAAMAQPGARGAPTLQAAALGSERIRLDGRLDEAVWGSASVARDFVQFEPREGEPASQRTEARVLYGTDALYVGIRAFDAAADSIVGQLTRRDQGSYSDEVGVSLDSYFDRRTAFYFAVNPVGVKKDVFLFDDTKEDSGWDAVWDVATSMDEEGWSAEFRIPLSQLRFRASPEQTWGIQLYRRVARLQELSMWSPTKRSESAQVSRMGSLVGLRDLASPRRVELAPYTLARLVRKPGDPADPFYSANDMAPSAGADLKMGVGGALTLDLSLNPDFGQVEADPSQVNLSAFESFFPERRPFFIEGRNLFNFSLALGDGDDAVESLFYSRRVGRPPQGGVDTDDAFVDADDHSTILGALKLSGKTTGGWSIGVMNAVTAEEHATVQPFSGARFEQPIEPMTAYTVMRFSKDFRGGRTAVGAVATAVHRDGTVADALDLRRKAYSTGFDFRHRFDQDRYEVSGYLVGSRVSGSADAIATTQRSSAHYYQRPDADYVEYDPARTSLSGASTSFSFGKIAGGHLRWSLGMQSRSPGFETNDIGYMREAGFTTGFLYAGYDQSTAQGPFRNWRLNVNAWNGASWGWEHANPGGNVNGNFQLKNFWGGYMGVGYNATSLFVGLLRGGPAFLMDAGFNGWGGLNSDSRKPLQLNLNVNWSVRPESDAWSIWVGPNVSWRPSGRTSLSVGPSFNRSVDDNQWIRRATHGGFTSYVFARMNQGTFGLSGRVDHAFTPDLTLQLYAQPFISSGSYGGFKRVTDPRAPSYADRFQPVQTTRSSNGSYTAQLEGESVALGNPDFDFRQFRSNAVVRWEYRPGSALYVVWAQGRTFSGENGDFALGPNLRGLFSVHPENVFMVKASYWISP
jgi:hypothetical protein